MLAVGLLFWAGCSFAVGSDNASCIHGSKGFRGCLPWEAASSRTAVKGSVAKEILMITSVASPFPCAIVLGIKTSLA